MSQATPPMPDGATMPLPVTSAGDPDGSPPASVSDKMIEVSKVSKTIGDTEILHDLSFEVRRGEIFGFIGPSGSGKTTTIRLLTGALSPTSGEVSVMGVAPNHPSRTVQEHFGYMPQLFVLYPTLTVEENLRFVASLYGLTPRHAAKRIDTMLHFVELYDARHRLAANVSGGMQRRLELAASLLHNPPLVFADEPTAGIDPVLRNKFWEEFRRLRDEGRTMFITTQYVGESEHCDRVGVIRRGRIIAIDSPVGLRRLAYGGDMVDVEATNMTAPVVQKLTELDFVHEVQPLNRRHVRVSVEEAGPAIPALLDVLSANQCNVVRVEEYRPNFDDVFIQLMKNDAEARGETEDAADE